MQETHNGLAALFLMLCFAGLAFMLFDCFIEEQINKRRAMRRARTERILAAMQRNKMRG